MATAPKLSYFHITKDPRVCGGKACVDLTRIRVIDIVQAHGEGYTPDQIRTLFVVPLTLAQIYSALAYADEFPDEIEADFASEARAEDEIEAARTEYLRQHGR
jgi:uncharacterized protein (DUF433 family)